MYYIHVYVMYTGTICFTKIWFSIVGPLCWSDHNVKSAISVGDKEALGFHSAMGENNPDLP